MPHLWKGSMVVHRSPIDMARGRASGLCQSWIEHLARMSRQPLERTRAPSYQSASAPSRTIDSAWIKTSVSLDGGGSAGNADRVHMRQIAHLPPEIVLQSGL
jgi:hypothetical protein